MCEGKHLEDIIQEYKDAGLHLFLDEICLLILAKEEYGKTDHYLGQSRIKWFREYREERGVPVPIPVAEYMKKHLSEIRVYLQKAIEGFGTKKNGVVNIPKKLIGQLMKADGLLAVIERGGSIEGSLYGYDVGMVVKRIDLALHYSRVWAQEGFE